VNSVIKHQKRATSKVRHKKAAAVSKLKTVQDDIAPAFDTHYSVPALHARYELGIQSNLCPLDFLASPTFPTTRHLHSFHKHCDNPLFIGNNQMLQKMCNVLSQVRELKVQEHIERPVGMMLQQEKWHWHYHQLISCWHEGG